MVSFSIKAAAFLNITNIISEVCDTMEILISKVISGFFKEYFLAVAKIITIFSKIFITIIIGPKKVVLSPEIGRVEKILSLTCPRGQMCIRIYIFDFKKKYKNNTKRKSKRN